MEGARIFDDVFFHGIEFGVGVFVDVGVLVGVYVGKKHSVLVGVGLGVEVFVDVTEGV